MSCKKIKNTSTGWRMTKIPDSHDGLIANVMLRDAAWFRHHPGKRSYTRDYIPGEAWPIVFPLATVCTVTFLSSGKRKREWDTMPLNDAASVGVIDVMPVGM